MSKVSLGCEIEVRRSGHTNCADDNGCLLKRFVKRVWIGGIGHDELDVLDLKVSDKLLPLCFDMWLGIYCYLEFWVNGHQSLSNLFELWDTSTSDGPFQILHRYVRSSYSFWLVRFETWKYLVVLGNVFSSIGTGKSGSTVHN